MPSSFTHSESASFNNRQEADQSSTELLRTHHQQRRAIYRIGDLAQAIFYDWAELFFYESLESVIQEYDHIKVVRNSNPQLPEGLHEKDIFSRSVLGPAILPSSCKNAVLSFRMCNSAVAFFWLVLEHFFKDLPLTIQEATMTQSHTPNRIILHTPSTTRDAKTYNHTIFLLTLYHNPKLNPNASDIPETEPETFALDLTSAQFGYTDTITPYPTYMTHHGAKIKSLHDFSYHAQTLHVFDEGPGWDVKVGLAVLLDGMLRHGTVPLPSTEQVLELDDAAFEELMRNVWVPGLCARLRMGMEFLCERGVARFVDGVGVVVGESTVRKEWSLVECILASREAGQGLR